jgi:hypothetical protein
LNYNAAIYLTLSFGMMIVLAIGGAVACNIRSKIPIYVAALVAIGLATGTQLYLYDQWTGHYQRAKAIALDQCGLHRLPATVDLPDAYSAAWYSCRDENARHEIPVIALLPDERN